MIAPHDCNHSYHEDGLEKHFAGHQTGHAELSVMERELQVRREKRALPKRRPHMGKSARETSQSSKEAVVGKDAVHGEPDLRGAARRHQTGTLLELMKPCQMGFCIRQKQPPHLSQLRFPSLDLKKPDTQPVLRASDGIADRRLRPIELIGSRRKSPQLNHSLKDLPSIERRVHGPRIHRINRCSRSRNATILRESPSSINPLIGKARFLRHKLAEPENDSLRRIRSLLDLLSGYLPAVGLPGTGLGMEMV